MSGQRTLSLDPELVYPHYASQGEFLTYAVPDYFNNPQHNTHINGHLRLSPLPPFFDNPSGDLLQNYPGSYDDLNQFFNDPTFGGGSPGPSAGGARVDLNGMTLHADEKNNSASRQPMVSDMHAAIQDWNQNAYTAGMEKITTDVKAENSLDCINETNEEQGGTVVKNGQVTPGQSPSSPMDSKRVRKATRQTKPTTKKVIAAIENAATDPDGPSAPPPKRTRKPRKSKKKPPTPEQEAAKRETFLKRNSEAAFKCRIKKKNQIESIIARAKQLDADNAMKGLEVERLKREIESLRAVLLPHWRECGDKNVAKNIDGPVSDGRGLSAAVNRYFTPVDAESERHIGGNVNGGEDMLMDVPVNTIDGIPEADEEAEQPSHKRRRSDAVFTMSMMGFDEAMATSTPIEFRRASMFGGSTVGNSLIASDPSVSSGSGGTPVIRPLDLMKNAGYGGVGEFGDTPPPLDLCAPDGGDLAI